MEHLETLEPVQAQISNGLTKKMDAIQTRLKLTDRQLIDLGTVIRQEEGRSAVEPNLREHLVEKKQLLEDFFVAEPVTYQKGEKNNETVIVPTIYCSDIMGLIREANNLF